MTKLFSPRHRAHRPTQQTRAYRPNPARRAAYLTMCTAPAWALPARAATAALDSISPGMGSLGICWPWLFGWLGL